MQWVAPLASESPELLVACLYAWGLKAGDSLGALLSSKVKQWTLLVGGLPIVFALTAGTVDGLPLGTKQRFELLITAAQSLFAVAILLDRSLTFRGAGLLLGLFSTQFLVSVLGTDTANRWTNHRPVDRLRRAGRGADRAPRADAARRGSGRSDHALRRRAVRG